MSVRDELIRALERDDEHTVRRLGWAPVYEAASTWWLPKQPMTMPQFVHYAKALGDHDPAVVLEAFHDTAGEWRPTVGALLGAINTKRDQSKAPTPGRARDKARAPEALAAVAAAIARGEQPCGCNARGSQLLVDAAGVTRCPGAAG